MIPLAKPEMGEEEIALVAETIRSGASCSTASRAAQSTARSDSSEPSLAATMGFADMLLLLAVIPSRTS